MRVSPKFSVLTTFLNTKLRESVAFGTSIAPSATSGSYYITICLLHFVSTIPICLRSIHHILFPEGDNFSVKLVKILIKYKNFLSTSDASFRREIGLWHLKLTLQHHLEEEHLSLIKCLSESIISVSSLGRRIENHPCNSPRLFGGAISLVHDATRSEETMKLVRNR